MSSDGDWSDGSNIGGDSYTEVSSRGWFSRIVGALVGIPIGLLLFLASFVVLFWNEGRSVRTARSLPEDLRDRLRVDNGRFYQGANPGAPQVGDVTVEFRQVQPTEVSVLAQQVGSSFRPYQTRSGDAINRLQLGVVSAADMFHAAEGENRLWTWGLRLLGFILMAVGIGMVLRPLAILGDVIPFIGDVVRFGTGFVATGIALVLSLVTIALGWITYRPLVELAVLAVAGLALYGFLRLARGRRRAAPGKRQNAPSPA